MFPILTFVFYVFALMAHLWLWSLLRVALFVGRVSRTDRLAANLMWLMNSLSFGYQFCLRNTVPLNDLNSFGEILYTFHVVDFTDLCFVEQTTRNERHIRWAAKCHPFGDQSSPTYMSFISCCLVVTS